jgi:hypothetical protein
MYLSSFVHIKRAKFYARRILVFISGINFEPNYYLVVCGIGPQENFHAYAKIVLLLKLN